MQSPRFSPGRAGPQSRQYVNAEALRLFSRFRLVWRRRPLSHPIAQFVGLSGRLHHFLFGRGEMQGLSLYVQRHTSVVQRAAAVFPSLFPLSKW